MNPNILISEKNLERDSWELFEVGSFDEVIRLAKENPSNSLLVHLGVIALIESGSSEAKTVASVVKGTSVFLPLVNAYQMYLAKNYRAANEQIAEYFKSSNTPICYSIANIGVKIALLAEDFHDALFIITTYKKRKKENPFLEEEIESLFALNSYKELIELFRENLAVLKDNSDILVKVGLSLYALEKFKEAEAILRNVPSRKELPSFEEKKKEYSHVIKEISTLEKRNDLNEKEIFDLGYAYLFSENYQKAESTFMKLLALAGA